MAKGTNKAILLGNVGRDPEIRSTAGGTIVAPSPLLLPTGRRTARETGPIRQNGTTWSPSTVGPRLFATT